MLPLGIEVPGSSVGAVRVPVPESGGVVLSGGVEVIGTEEIESDGGPEDIGMDVAPPPPVSVPISLILVLYQGCLRCFRE